MADIRIKKKKPVWPWIILLIVILITVYIFVVADDETTLNDRAHPQQIDETEEAMQNDTIN